MPVQAEALKHDASDSVLRRHSASLVDSWDSWLGFLLSSGKVSVISLCPDRSAVLVQLRAAKAVFEASMPPPPLAGPLGGGLGLQTPPSFLAALCPPHRIVMSTDQHAQAGSSSQPGGRSSRAGYVLQGRDGDGGA